LLEEYEAPPPLKPLEIVFITPCRGRSRLHVSTSSRQADRARISLCWPSL